MCYCDDEPDSFHLACFEIILEVNTKLAVVQAALRLQQENVGGNKGT